MGKTEMEIVETMSGLVELAKVEKGCVLTIGNFDGVHLGHQEILIATRQIAAKRRAQLVVMTFEPHPLVVLHPQKNPGILTSLALKKHLLAEFGVNCLFVLESTPELLGLSPQDFVEQFIWAFRRRILWSSSSLRIFSPAWWLRAKALTSDVAGAVVSIRCRS
jgi:FAD synthase